MFLLGWWFIGCICWGFLVIAPQRPLRSWNNLWPFGVPGSCFKAAEPDSSEWFRSHFEPRVPWVKTLLACDSCRRSFVAPAMMRADKPCGRFPTHSRGDFHSALKWFGHSHGIILFQDALFCLSAFSHITYTHITCKRSHSAIHEHLAWIVSSHLVSPIWNLFWHSPAPSKVLQDVMN